MNTIEEQICGAIDILVNKAVAQANYDKTIQATVVCCVDATIGKYKVRYQDSTFYAYSTNSDVTYSDGAIVYVLIPGNDIDIDKTILGTVKKLGINYVATVEDDEAYEIIGNNVITSTATYGLSSYRPDFVKTIYDKNSGISENLSLNIKALEEYTRNSESIICGATFRTELDIEQQFRGDYGILFRLVFKDNTNNAEVKRDYMIHVDNMRGNPYKTLHDTRQYGIFDVDGKNFIRLDNISLFCRNFPNSYEDSSKWKSDIFVSNIELCAAARLNNDDLNGYCLTFLTLQGTYFDERNIDSDVKSIEAQVRVKGKVIDNNSQKLAFYWFTEHVGITSDSEFYNKYGGQGWKCLNAHNIIKPATSTEPAIVEWIPGSYVWAVKKLDIKAKEVRYKCAVVYDGTVISKIITIKNLASSYEVSISSSDGTQFYFDNGFPTLTCNVKENGRIKTGCTFSWAVTNNVDNFETIVETPEINSAYQTAYNNYHNLLNNIQNEVVPLEPNRQLLENYRIALAQYDRITRVDKNVIYHLNVNTITNFSTYQCTVYYGSIYLGTASIVLKNDLTAEGEYNLVIHDSSKVYKYNENGVSPACSALDSPIEIQALTFSVYDNLGNRIDDEVVRHSNIRWIVPITNTMIKIPNLYGDDYEEDLEQGIRIYKNLMAFAYEIEDRFDIAATNNDIEVLVDYKGMSLSNKTDLVFVKEGDAGTNGTEFVCRIVPNIVNGTKMPAYPMVTEDYYHTPRLNYSSRSYTQWLKVQLWHNENKIFDAVTSGNTSEGKYASVKWEILKNQYKTSLFDPSALSVDVNGNFSFNGYKYGESAPANIVKATIEYDGVVYYATLLFVTGIIKNENYRISRKANSGFSLVVYSSDGQRPRYDNTNPFEAIVEQKVTGGYWEDVSLKETSAYKVTYDWKCNIGSIYEDNVWKTTPMLKAYGNVYYPNQYGVKPADAYDGECVTNAVEVTVKHGGTEVCRMHMPVQMMLNRYGNSAINSWDGNSVQVDSEGGFILAPQVGAGKKNSDNSFTGVVMGKVKETNESTEDIGLVGYNKGVRSIFLDSEDGSAVFGTKNNGKLIIDPSQNKAMLYSWNYWKQYNKKGKPNGYGSTNVNDKGMLINLTDSYIHFGSAESGKLYSGEHTALSSTKDGFYLSQDGLSIGSGFKIYAGGKSEINHKDSDIGHWTVTDDGLVSNDENGILLDANNSTIHLIGAKGKIYSASHKTFSDNSNTGFYLANDGLSIVSKYKQTEDGVEKTITSRLEMATNKNPKIYSNGKSTLSSTREGFYLAHDGLSIGKDFVISSDGKAVIDREGSDLGNWKVKYDDDGNLVGLVSKSGSGILLDSKSSLIVLGSSKGKIYSGSHIALSNDSEGFYLAHDGLSIGSKVYISKTGTVRLGGGAVKNTGKHWVIDNVTNESGTVVSSYIKHGNMNAANSVYISTNMISLGKKFYVDDTGVMRLGYQAVEAGTSGKYWTIDGDSSKAYIGYKATKSELTTTSSEVSIGEGAQSSSVYLGTDGIRLGKKFAVDASGNVLMKYLTATGGKIGGWKISANKLTGQKSDGHYIELNSNGSIKTGTVEGNSGWEIKRNGSAVFKNITADGKGNIGGATLSDGKLTVHTAQIDSAAITTAKIADAAVTTAKIKDANITTAKINDAAITTAKIGNGQITNAKIADATIKNAKIEDATITNAKIANLTITGSKIAGSTITGGKIASGTITGSNIANSTITGGKIASATIEGSNIKDSTITGGKIANAAITSAKIADSAITASKISNSTITGSKIANSTITNAKISGTISADHIDVSSLSIGAGQISVSGLVGNNNKHEGQTFSMHFLRNLTDQMIIYFCKGICVGYSQN